LARTAVHGTRSNPRSTTEGRAQLFTKSSRELSLEGEAEELARCRERSIRTAHVSTPELLGYDPATNTLTTALVPESQSLYNAFWNGTSLLRRLLGRGVEEQLVCSRVREIGAWLRLYHDESSGGCDGTAAGRQLGESLEAKVATVRRYGLIEEDLLSRVQAFCLGEFSRVADLPYLAANGAVLCRVQGDFIASNLVVDAEFRVFVTDFADTHVGVSIEDLGRFCEQLLALSRCGAYRRGLFEEARREFLEGYGAIPDLCRTPLYKAVVFLNVLISLITEYTTRRYISRQLLTRYELKRLAKATFTWMVEELDTAEPPATDPGRKRRES
jgi:hypothetical protein